MERPYRRLEPLRWRTAEGGGGAGVRWGVLLKVTELDDWPPQVWGVGGGADGPLAAIAPTSARETASDTTRVGGGGGGSSCGGGERSDGGGGGMLPALLLPSPPMLAAESFPAFNGSTGVLDSGRSIRRRRNCISSGMLRPAGPPNPGLSSLPSVSLSL